MNKFLSEEEKGKKGGEGEKGKGRKEKSSSCFVTRPINEAPSTTQSTRDRRTTRGRAFRETFSQAINRVAQCISKRILPVRDNEYLTDLQVESTVQYCTPPQHLRDWCDWSVAVLTVTVHFIYSHF